MPRFRIKPTDTIEVFDGAYHTFNALDQLRAAVEAAALWKATLKQNQQSGFTDIWRVTLPNKTAEAMFKLAGGQELIEEFGV